MNISRWAISDLFNQAIQLSGSIFSESNLDRNVVEDSKKLAKAAGCDQEDSKGLRDCIEIRTVDELLDAMEQIVSFRVFF